MAPDLSKDGLIRCHIRHTTIDADYQCLSYRWGDLKVTQTILIHDDLVQEEKSFGVSQNLYDYLATAQQLQGRSSMGLHLGLDGELWIDALCIDQTSTGERNHQVALMGKIFSEAGRTIIWLGNSTTDGYHWKDMIEKEGDTKKPPLHVRMRSLTQDEYWNRAWITQEVILARDPIVLLGEFVTPYNSLYADGTL